MLVALVHNAVSPDDSEAERDVLEQVEAVRGALVELGHRFEIVPVTLDLEQFRRRLLELRPDVVFNLVESLAGSDAMAAAATMLYDAMRIPYAGSHTEATFLTNQKLLAKEKLRAAGLPTPHWLSAHHVDGQLTSPYIIKAVREHASFGLDEGSVFWDDDVPAAQRVRDFSERLGCECFAEQYIDGREFNLSVLAGPVGPQVLPPAEIDFSAFPEGKTRVVGQRAKWDDGSFEFHNTPRRFDYPDADRPLLERLALLARDCWHAFGLKGWVRVDFRVDGAGRPWVLEINTNPCISPDAGFAAALARAGISFPAAIARILADAIGNKIHHGDTEGTEKT